MNCVRASEAQTSFRQKLRALPLNFAEPPPLSMGFIAHWPSLGLARRQQSNPSLTRAAAASRVLRACAKTVPFWAQYLRRRRRRDGGASASRFPRGGPSPASSPPSRPPNRTRPSVDCDARLDDDICFIPRVSPEIKSERESREARSLLTLLLLNPLFKQLRHPTQQQPRNRYYPAFLNETSAFIFPNPKTL